jgi:hypothetical protein
MKQRTRRLAFGSLISGEPNNVFYMFEVASTDKAREFIGNPDAAQAGEASGVIDGEYHFVEDAGSYR